MKVTTSVRITITIMTRPVFKSKGFMKKIKNVSLNHNVISSKVIY